VQPPSVVLGVDPLLDCDRDREIAKGAPGMFCSTACDMLVPSFVRDGVTGFLGGCVSCCAGPPVQVCVGKTMDMPLIKSLLCLVGLLPATVCRSV
jgi:hypothetical protein